MENVTDRPPERSILLHYTDGADPQTWCGLAVGHVAPAGLTLHKAQVTCPGCLHEDRMLAALDPAAHTPAELAPPTGDDMPIMRDEPPLCALVEQLGELTRTLRPMAEHMINTTSSPAGRDQGDSRSDPGEASPAVATTGQPGDQPLDERAEQIAGLRQLVDWLEAHPEAPIQATERRYTVFPRMDAEDDLAGQLAELRRLGDVLGLDPEECGSRHVSRSGPEFRGGVTVEVIVCDAADLVRAEQAAETLLGVEEVAGPAGVTDPATAPDAEQHTPVAGWTGRSGTSGVECSCGVVYDGFDTIAQAEAQRVQHAEPAG